MVLLTACHSNSYEDFREEGQGVVKSIIEVTKRIHTRQQLIANSKQLKILFENLVDVAINAHEYSLKHPQAEKSPFTLEERAVSDLLRAEINRLCQMDGAQEILEKCQEDALNRLDAYFIKNRSRQKAL